MISVLVLTSHINDSTLLGSTLFYSPKLFLFYLAYHIFLKKLLWLSHGSQSQSPPHKGPITECIESWHFMLGILNAMMNFSMNLKLQPVVLICVGTNWSGS